MTHLTTLAALLSSACTATALTPRSVSFLSVASVSTLDSGEL